MSSRSFWRNEADKIRNDRSAVDTSELFANPWEESSKLRKINIRLTDETSGTYYILDGYSQWTGKHIDHQYKVPLYKLIVSGVNNEGDSITREYWVIRFGVWEEVNRLPQLVSVPAGTYQMKQWIPTYLNDFDGATPGAWVIIRRYYMHDGQDTPPEQWGAIGCVEVVGKVNENVDKFENLNYLIRVLSGTKKKGDEAYFEIAREKLITIIVEKALTPKLIKV
jgi:hypothetical protein